MESVKTGNYKEVYKSYSSGGKLNFKKFQTARYKNKGGRNLQVSRDSLSQNLFATEMLLDPRISDVFSTASANLLERQLARRGMRVNLTQSREQMVYKAMLPDMGYINCDRFMDFPPEMMATIEVENSDSAMVAVCVKRFNSLMFTYKKDNREYIRVPVGEKISIVAVKIKEGSPCYQKLELTAGKDVEVKIDTKPGKLREIAVAMASL